MRVASIQDAFNTILTTNATLLTGGVFNLRDLGTEFISPTNTPAVYEANGVTIKPFGVVTWRSETVTNITAGRSRYVVVLNLYQPFGYGTIQSTLHTLKSYWKQRFGQVALTGDDEAGFIRMVSVSNEIQSVEFNMVSMAMITFEANTEYQI